MHHYLLELNIILYKSLIVSGGAIVTLSCNSINGFAVQMKRKCSEAKENWLGVLCDVIYNNVRILSENKGSSRSGRVHSFGRWQYADRL